MDFEYSQEQRMLADSLQRLVAENWTHAQRRARQGGLDRAAWQALAELGVTGLTIPAEYGGFGEPPDSLLPVHLELGRGLVDEPVIASGVIGATLIGACGAWGEHGNAAARHWLPRIASGEAIVTLAYQEPGRRYATEPEICRLSERGAALILNGSKDLVWHAAAAQAWIVSAVDAASREPVLLLVSRDVPGATVTETTTLDRSRCARIDFDQTPVAADAVLARGETVRAALALALQWGAAALCAHAAGAMARLLDITADYLKTRRQFGQPLAAFQALQHRIAEMAVAREMGLSMAYVAVAALSEPDERQRRRMIAAAKLEVARAGRLIGQYAVQLHGGMGMTDELEVGDYFKRLTVFDLLLGDSAEQLATLAETAPAAEVAELAA
ncbi:MAG: acyl-CoA dehydrogenase [Burkholderiaceae bacterium]|jgi:alkylation response protein AidB-like acyl-CoA dehydrogenase|nr:acyl-CoA dehydrogenase [Burkholderiaceae bacterium]